MANFLGEIRIAFRFLFFSVFTHSRYSVSEWYSFSKMKQMVKRVKMEGKGENGVSLRRNVCFVQKRRGKADF